MSRSLVGLVACAALVAPSVVSAQPTPKPDARLWAVAQAAQEPALDFLAQLVAIDSQTGDKEGAARVQALLTPRLRALGAVSIETVPSESPAVADNLVARFRGKGQAKILLIAHLDTVFPRGSAAARPFRREGDRAYGPGVGDEKGGLVAGITALSMLNSLGRADYGTLTLLVDGSEETGSPGSTQLIRRLAREHDVELNLEPGDPPDAITVWRKGSTKFAIEVKGRAAHSGVAPQDGRNAAAELVNQLSQLGGFPKSGEQETVNLTVMRAGERNNIIPDAAQATLDVRVCRREQVDVIEAELKRHAAAPSVEGTTVSVSRSTSFPPLAGDARTMALAERAARLYGELGRKIVFGGNGGASQSALAAAEGTPALDGLGFVGGDFHTDKEWIDLTTVAPRLYLLARLIEDLSKSPPKTN